MAAPLYNTESGGSRVQVISTYSTLSVFQIYILKDSAIVLIDRRGSRNSKITIDGLDGSLMISVI